jgi:hypothetical protein
LIHIPGGYHEKKWTKRAWVKSGWKVPFCKVTSKIH